MRFFVVAVCNYRQKGDSKRSMRRCSVSDSGKHIYSSPLLLLLAIADTKGILKVL